MTKNWRKKFQPKKNDIFLKKNPNYLSQEKLSVLKRKQLYSTVFSWVIFALFDPDQGPLIWLNPDLTNPDQKHCTEVKQADLLGQTGSSPILQMQTRVRNESWKMMKHGPTSLFEENQPRKSIWLSSSYYRHNNSVNITKPCAVCRSHTGKFNVNVQACLELGQNRNGIVQIVLEVQRLKTKHGTHTLHITSNNVDQTLSHINKINLLST